MKSSPGQTIISLVLLVGCSAGCGERTTYQLQWQLTCGDGGKTCAIKNVQDCSRHGLNTIEVLSEQLTQQASAFFPCYRIAADEFGPQGPIGMGPDLLEGDIQLTVAGLSAGSFRISGPVTAKATLTAGQATEVSVTLPAPMQCNDSVDNDNDGLVDLLDKRTGDSGCTDTSDNSE